MVQLNLKNLTFNLKKSYDLTFNLKKSYNLTFNLKKSYILLDKSYILTMKIDISTWKYLTRNFREADYLPQNRARINTAYRYQ